MSHISVRAAETSANFLSSAVGLTLKTAQISQEGVTADQYGNKIVPAGTIYPANTKDATGIVFEPVDVTDGDREGSIIVAGRVLKDRLPDTPVAAAVTALNKSGIVFDEAADVVREAGDETAGGGTTPAVDEF